MTPKKRKELEKLILESMSLVDKSEINTNTYKRKFEAMTDNQFDKYIKDLITNDDMNFYMQTIPFKNQPTLKDIKEGLSYLEIPCEEYVYYRHLSSDPEDPIRSKLRVPVGYMFLKRLQQSLSKKNSYSLSIDKRNQKTGQVTSDDKVARIADSETISLTVMGADSALKEFLGPRADNKDSKIEMYQRISEDGYLSLNDLSNNIESSQTINTVDTFFLGAGITTDLITPSLALPRTLKMKEKRESTASRLEKQ